MNEWRSGVSYVPNFVSIGVKFHRRCDKNHIQAAILKIQNGGNNDISSTANIDILIIFIHQWQ